MSVQSERVREAFGRAEGYDAAARVQQDVARSLAAKIAEIPLPPTPRVLEIGCGTGFLTEALRAHGIVGEWLVTDLSPAMVARCAARIGSAPGLRYAVLDGERGEPDGGPFDLVCSSLALQWFEDAPAALNRMRRWLAPGGHCIVATRGPGTFAEWRAAHRAEGLVAGTPDFASAETFSQLDPLSWVREERRERHGSARAFLRALKTIGAGTPSPAHRPLPPADLRRVMERFEADGGAVTYEVLTLHLKGSA